MSERKKQLLLGESEEGQAKRTKFRERMSAQKKSRMSDDARDGIELMHQMVLSVQAGKPIDPASALAEMEGAKRLSFGSELPLSFSTFNTASAGPSHRDNKHSSDQYHPALDRFLEQCREIFNNMYEEVNNSRTNANDQLTVRVDAGVDSSQSNHFHSILDQTPVKRGHSTDQLAELECSGGSGSWRQSTGNETAEENSRIEQHQTRVQEAQKRVQERAQELQAAIQQYNTEVNALLAAQRQHQQQIDAQSQQKQLQQQMLVHQQLIAATQSQHAATQHQHQPPMIPPQQSAAAQLNQALIAAVANNQLELMLNEIQTQYSRQLTAQQLLAQLTQLGLLNSIATQDLAALQSIASGAALNGVVHQMSPMAQAAAAAALHSPPVAAQPPHRPQAGPSPASSAVAPPVVGVQNFLSSLESLSSSNADEQHRESVSVAANVAAVAVELGHTSNQGMIFNSASSPSCKQLNPIGQATSLSLHQVSQNFSCPASVSGVHHAIPCSSTSLQLSRESTVAEVVAEVAALPTTVPRKPFRPRPTRTGGNAGKRGGQNSQKQQQQQTAEDPKKQEEIERQIQDIVAKALEVDSAAKCAEKERKARSGEKRSKDKTNGASNVAAATISTTSPMSLPSSSSLAAMTSATILDKMTPVVQPLPARGHSSIEYQVKADNAIMQNFLSAAVAASQHKQLQSNIGIGSSATNELSPLLGSNDFRVHSIAAPSSFGHKMEVQSPGGGFSTTFGSTEASLQQSQFPFTPSSVSLAIQQGAMPHFSTVSGDPATGGPPFASPLLSSPAIFSASASSHPGESCSPPFISLNLPPASTSALVPPSKVVVKVEPKLPSAPTNNNFIGPNPTNASSTKMP